MNYIKKLGTMGRSSADQRDHALGLTHLRKLFAEFRHPTRKATQEEQEYKLYNMIPLFVKVPCLCLQDVNCYPFFSFFFLPPPSPIGSSSRSLEGKVWSISFSWRNIGSSYFTQRSFGQVIGRGGDHL